MILGTINQGNMLHDDSEKYEEKTLICDTELLEDAAPLAPQDVSPTFFSQFLSCFSYLGAHYGFMGLERIICKFNFFP